MAELDFQKMPDWMPDALEIMALIETWARAYEVPREAILRQIPIAYAWSRSNKRRAPKKQVTRFLHTWMRNAKGWGNLVVAQPDRRYRAEEPEPDMTVEEMREIRRQNMPAHRG
jgi:hypothetical protein